MKASLDDSTESFVGQTLVVRPFHGYGWTEASAESREFSHRSIAAPELFVVRLERLWGTGDDARRGGVARVENPGHLLDGMWLVFSTRHEGIWNFTDRLGVYNVDLSSIEPSTHKDGWPQYPAESRPVRAYQGWAEIHSPLVRSDMDKSRLRGETSEEPLTKRERAELQGYVAPGAAVGRAVLFLIAVAIVGGVSWRVQQGLSIAQPLWILPPLLFAIFLYRRAGRWTGGHELRDLVRKDLAGNVARVHRVRVRDAIVFEEQEDEGPAVFILTHEGDTVVFRSLRGSYRADSRGPSSTCARRHTLADSSASTGTVMHFPSSIGLRFPESGIRNSGCISFRTGPVFTYRLNGSAVTAIVRLRRR
jgi:hypothetical protein